MHRSHVDTMGGCGSWNEIKIVYTSQQYDLLHSRSPNSVHVCIFVHTYLHDCAHVYNYHGFFPTYYDKLVMGNYHILS